ncbi:DUF924 domain-containing protein [Lysobacter pythonis]|uniref:DUF924 domain-containing protein n=2 Tax=Solilutibacter pythonis TaxID=2483112 RepID=A0A3M2I0S4_9GAMM|nr:DUF924 domain-containing protein [Lysobacter pythonis]
MKALPTAGEIVAFWRAAGRAKWFGGGVDFDAECRVRFEPAHLAAARGALAHWLEDAESALALSILLDQMPRNIWRGGGHAFATDGLARRYASQAIAAGHDGEVEPALRGFFYLPLEHSESLADQYRSVALFAALGDPVMHDYAIRHREVIERFGRFPHRNAALGRIDTAEEAAWLAAGGGF